MYRGILLRGKRSEPEAEHSPPNASLIVIRTFPSILHPFYDVLLAIYCSSITFLQVTKALLCSHPKLEVWSNY